MRYGQHTKRYMKPYGGMAFLDAINEGLLTIPHRNRYDWPDTLTIAGVEWELLSSGIYRVAYRYEGLVLKFPYSQGKKDTSNTREWEVYERAMQRKVQRYFAAALALLDEWPYGTVALMEFVERPRYLCNNITTRTWRTLRKHGIMEFDTHLNNVYDKRIIDYGNFSLSHLS